MDYRGFKNLLEKLENNLRLIDITKVDFNPAAETVHLSAKTYYLTEK